MADRRAPHVFTIPSGVPFLPTLADAFLSGKLLPDVPADPLAMAGATIFLPTRRAARTFAEVLTAKLGGVAILPAIRPLGDVDEEDQLLAPASGLPADRLIVPPAVSRLARQLKLADLALEFRQALRRVMLDLDDDAPVLIPASAADATRLAADLARLFDDMAAAGVSFDDLAKLAPDDYARWFQLTLEFLKVVGVGWPEYLAAAGRADPVARRDELIRAEAVRLAASGGPVIAAGSTGSLPATADLLAAIACMDRGAVVLPGLDQMLDQPGWEKIGDATESHPQAALKRLIARLGVAREAVVPLAEPPAEIAARARLLSDALRPASTTEAWRNRAAEPERALAGVDVLVGRNEQEEALAIALAIREALETPDRTIALVTPDRTLARRVAVEMGRWGLALDDSAGTPLARLPAGIFAQLLLDAADGDPVTLLALVKHPFAAFGLRRDECRRAARILDLAVFRWRRVTGGIAALPEALQLSRRETDDPEVRSPRARQRLRDWQWDLAARLAAALATTLGPLEARLAEGPVSTTEAAALVAAAYDIATRDAAGEAPADAARRGGATLGLLLAELADPATPPLAVHREELAVLFGALLAEVAVPGLPGLEPRVHVWGQLEARLQHADLVILGGLDEGVWPAATRNDPFLSRAMRAGIGLPPPERRIGLSAHDFAEALAAPRVIVTRAEKRGGSPTVASRWLQRLEAVTGAAANDAMRARGDRFVMLARRLDRVEGSVAPTRRPEPKPPLEVRPRRLSVTAIETLVRDPYAIYAKHILRLEPLDPIGVLPDARLRGTLIHEALSRFTGAWQAGDMAVAEARLVEIGRETLAEIADFPEAHALWSERFAAVARWFTHWEAGRAAAVLTRHSEVEGALVLPAPFGPFTLSGRADRIDEMADGTVAIYDFKTGTPQTERTVFAGLTPQLALEAAMVRAGAFDAALGTSLAGRSISDLAWLAVGKAGRDDPYVSAVKRDQTPDGLADRAHDLLAGLIAAFDDPARGYLSRARPMMESARYVGDYDHLARVREWALMQSEEDVSFLAQAGAS